MLVIGEKEAEAGEVSVRARNGNTETMSLADFVAKAVKENAEKTR